MIIDFGNGRVGGSTCIFETPEQRRAGGTFANRRVGSQEHWWAFADLGIFGV
jgi:hypothetical protein